MKVKSLNIILVLLLMFVQLPLQLAVSTETVSASTQSVTLRPNAAGDETNLTLLAGSAPAVTNWESVDEVTADDDVTYIESGHTQSPFVTDLYNLSGTSLGGVIHSVTVWARFGAEPVPNQASAKLRIKTNGVAYDSDTSSINGTITVTQAYADYSYKYTTNPQTGAAWTWTEIVDLQAGAGMIQAKSTTGTRDTKLTQVWVVVSYDDDVTPPTVTAVLPATSSTVNGTQVSYNLSETAASGTITWTRTGGAADASSPHAQALSGSELNSGAHQSITLTNDPTLADGAIYSIAWDVTDLAGNAATTVTSTSVTYDAGTQAPTLTTPAQDAYDNASVAYSFTLPEAATSGSVNLTFTRTGGTADANAPHIVTFDYTTAATHSGTLVGGDLSTSPNVTAVSSGASDALVDGAVYTVTASYQDASGNDSAADSNTGFTYDTTAPTVTISSTVADPTSTSPIPVRIDFNESVTGFAVSDITVGNGTAGDFAGSGANYTINVTPTADGTVTVDVAAGVAQNAALVNNTAALQFSITYQSDLTAPTVSAFSPLDGSVNVAVSQNLVITFSENMTIGTGNITIRKYSDDTIVQNFAATTDNVSVSGAAVTINPPSDLGNGLRYYVTIDGGALTDTAAPTPNAYAGISSKDTWDFTTIQADATIVFTTTAQAVLEAGQVSEIITFQMRDSAGNPLAMGVPTTVNLTSNSVTGFFYSDASAANQITSVVVPGGSSSGSFYYKETGNYDTFLSNQYIGSPTITAAEHPSIGWTDATQQQTVKARPRLVITSPHGGQYLGGGGYATTEHTVTINGTALALPNLTDASLIVNGASRWVQVTNGSFSTSVVLVDGLNTVEVSADNILGNGADNITITHNVAPEVRITSPVTGTMLQATPVTLEGTVSAYPAVTTANLTVNGDISAIPVSGGAFSVNVTLHNGQNILAVSARNDYGAGTSGNITLILNAEIPAVTITSPAPNLVTRFHTVNVTGTVVDDTSISSANLTVNGVRSSISVLAADNSFNAAVTLVEGTNVIEVSATDGTFSGSDSVTVISDTIAPVVQIASPLNNYITSNSTPTVTGSVDDTTITSATLTLNGVNSTVPVTNGAFSQAVTLASGENTVHVTATDAAGNAGVFGIVVVYDNTKPEVTIISPTSNYITGDASLEVTGTVASGSAISQVTLSLNGVESTVPVTGNRFSTDVTIIPGVNRIEVSAADSAVPPNVGSSGIVTVTLDKTAPRIDIYMPADGSLMGVTAVTITGHVTDNAITLVRSATLTLNGVDSAVSVDDNSDFSVAVTLQNGTNTILVTATDAYGNTGSSNTVIVDVDTSDPAVAIDSPPNGFVTRIATQPVSGSVTHSQAITSVTLNHNGSFKPITYTGSASGVFGATVTLVEGENSIVVRASDASSPAKTGASGIRMVTLDTTAPAISLTSPAAGLLVNQPSVLVSGTVDDPYVTSAVLTVGGNQETIPVQAGTFSRTVTGLAAGANSISLSAVDGIGNSGSTGTITVNYDAAAPTVSITSPVNGYRTNNATVNITGRVVDVPPLTTASLTLNGAVTQVPVAGDNYSAQVTLTEGQNTVSVSATDGVNTGNSGAVTITLDSTAPALTINLGDPGDNILITVSSDEPLQSPPTVTLNPAVAMTLTETDTWTGTYPASGTLAAGSYTVVATGTDEAGNQSTRQATFTKNTISVSENTTTQVSTNTTTIQLSTTANVTNAWITITEHSDNPAENTESEKEAGVFVEILTNEDMRNQLESVIIVVEYDEAELAAQGIDESTLKLYWWNTGTGQWELVANSTVDIINNKITGTVDHLSEYGIFGTAAVTPPTPPTPTPPPGNGGNGGAIPAPPPPPVTPPTPPRPVPVPVTPPQPTPPGALKLADYVDGQGTLQSSIVVTASGGDPQTPGAPVDPNRQTARIVLRAGTTLILRDADNPTVITVPTQLELRSIPIERLAEVYGGSGVCPLPEGAIVIGEVWHAGIDGMQFSQNADLTLSYREEDIPEGFTEDDIIMITCDGAGWYANLVQNINKAVDELTAEVSHFSYFALVVMHTPADIIASDLFIEPSTAKAGERVTINVRLVNRGDADGEYSVTVYVNGNPEKTVVVAVAGMQSEIVRLDTVRFDQGVYSVKIDGLSDSFTVLPDSTVVSPLVLPEAQGFNYLALIIGLLALLAAFVGAFIFQRQRQRQAAVVVATARVQVAAPVISRMVMETAPAGKGFGDAVSDWLSSVWAAIIGVLVLIGRFAATMVTRAQWTLARTMAALAGALPLISSVAAATVTAMQWTLARTMAVLAGALPLINRFAAVMVMAAGWTLARSTAALAGALPLISSFAAATVTAMQWTLARTMAVLAGALPLINNIAAAVVRYLVVTLAYASGAIRGFINKFRRTKQ